MDQSPLRSDDYRSDRLGRQYLTASKRKQDLCHLLWGGSSGGSSAVEVDAPTLEVVVVDSSTGRSVSSLTVLAPITIDGESVEEGVRKGGRP